MDVRGADAVAVAQYVGPEGRGFARVPANGGSGTASSGEDPTAVPGGDLDHEAPDDGLPENGHAQEQSVGRDAAVGEETAHTTAAQDEAGPGAGGATARVEPRAADAVQGMERSGGGSGRGKGLGGTVQVAGAPGTGRQDVEQAVLEGEGDPGASIR